MGFWRTFDSSDVRLSVYMFLCTGFSLPDLNEAPRFNTGLNE